MGFVQEFKEFAVKGNMIDLAVGIIIGGAFGKIVSSLVADVIMPPIGLLLGGVDFTGLAISMKSPLEGAKPVTINYGNFIQTVVDFTVIAFCVFMLVKAVNSLKREKETAPPPPPPKSEILLEEIRDLLKKA